MIHQRESVLQAIAECDSLGRKEFLKKYGYGASRSYTLLHEGNEYDSKAIVGVAYGFENPSEGPLQAKEFSGGEATVQKWLESLGFEVSTPEESGATPKAFILTWNPTKWEWPEFEQVVSRSRAGHVISEPWSTGNNRSMGAGERVYLYRQATNQGLIASGYTTSAVYLDMHWDGSGRQAGYASVDFDTVLPESEVLPFDDLDQQNFGIQWNRIQASGISVPAESVEALEHQWREHLTGLNRLTDRIPEEINTPSRYVEGASRIVTVNAYERSTAARRDCIARWGLDCSVCGFNFSQAYGDLGNGFIHVHHLRELATIGKEYEVNPEEDLRPVCPNCHAMLHRTVPAMSIEALRDCLGEKGQSE